MLVESDRLVERRASESPLERLVMWYFMVRGIRQWKFYRCYRSFSFSSLL